MANSDIATHKQFGETNITFIDTNKQSNKFGKNTNNKLFREHKTNRFHEKIKHRMSIHLTTFNCKNCLIPLAKNEVISRDYTTITINPNANLTINKSEFSNWLNCKRCKRVVGLYSSFSDTNTLLRTSLIKVTYESV